MPSKILLIRTKTWRQLLQQKVAYRNPRRVRSSLKKSSVFKPFSIVGNSHFNEANKSLRNFLKILSKSGQIAPTVHKQALTKEIVEKLYEEGELVDIDSLQPHKVQQTAWFFISLFLGKRGRENQQLLKKHMLISGEVPNGVKYLEINKERGEVLATKNHQRKNIWKTRLKTLPSETHREIPVTSESQMQQFIPETKKPVQSV